MDKLIKAFDGKEMASDLKKVLSKNGLEVEDSKLKDLLTFAKNEMNIENVSGGSMEGIIKGVGILSGAVMGGIVSGTVIPKATGINSSGKGSAATLAVAGESVAGMAGGAYIGYEVSDTIINFLKRKNIL